MRFRATVQNVLTFYRLIQTVEKLQKRCIINFSETAMCIICNNEEGGVQVWSLSYSLPLQQRDHPQPPHLSTALRSASAESTGANEVVMKLAKKSNIPMGRRVKVSHDVRIEVTKPADVAMLTEPRCPEPDVQIMLPLLAKMCAIVERMRSLSDVIGMRANSSGCLQLSARTEVVNASAEDEEKDKERERPDPKQLFSVLVHTRSFLKFLNAHVVSKTTIACICQGHCLILFVYIGDSADVGGVLTFYIPSALND
ncbi:Hus1-like protein-domain-containing protein [Multifurca ochricompacta]|uniref:Checkpoint protein n=1 Tax=Multifurca ochricompacta TaxID=376703 RepID=A0AAD4LWC5_9AGAM|nr:Hus1-like protein-domain-containing protein [Multifurca ochricompacta]